jgi:hypothetical protein
MVRVAAAQEGRPVRVSARDASACSGWIAEQQACLSKVQMELSAVEAEPARLAAVGVGSHLVLRLADDADCVGSMLAAGFQGELYRLAYCRQRGGLVLGCHLVPVPRGGVFQVTVPPAAVLLSAGGAAPFCDDGRQADTAGQARRTLARPHPPLRRFRDSLRRATHDEGTAVSGRRFARA